MRHVLSTAGGDDRAAARPDEPERTCPDCGDRRHSLGKGRWWCRRCADAEEQRGAQSPAVVDADMPPTVEPLPEGGVPTKPVRPPPGSAAAFGAYRVAYDRWYQWHEARGLFDVLERERDRPPLEAGVGPMGGTDA